MTGVVSLKTYHCSRRYCLQDGFFTTLDKRDSASTSDPLEEYLQAPPIPGVMDPVKYWHSINDGNNPLARMALDILSAPGSSPVSWQTCRYADALL